MNKKSNTQSTGNTGPVDPKALDLKKNIPQRVVLEALKIEKRSASKPRKEPKK